MDREATTVREALKQRAKTLPPTWTMYYEDQQHLPAALTDEGIRADAVAVGPEGGIVFEVVVKRSPKSRQKIQKLERLRPLLAQTPEWKLEVIVASERAPLASQDETTEKLRTAESMVSNSGGNQQILQAAYLLGFSALERSIARLAEENGLPYSPNAARMTESLVSSEVLPQDLYTTIQSMQDVRNRIAHAHSIASGIMETDVLDVISMAQEIANPADIHGIQ